MSNKKDKTTIELEEHDGAIVFKKDGLEEQYVIPTTDDSWGKGVRETIAFFIYATQRLDWVVEFQAGIGKILEEELEPEGKKPGPHLRLLK